jgi:hypothetical protein
MSDASGTIRAEVLIHLEAENTIKQFAPTAMSARAVASSAKIRRFARVNVPCDLAEKVDRRQAGKNCEFTQPWAKSSISA